MKILILNSWSSSLKYQVFNDNILLAKWQIERIWKDDAIFSYEKLWENKDKSILPITDHKNALHNVLEKLINRETGVLTSIQEIKAVWHRVVHGWEYFSKAVIIDDYVISKIEELSSLAPLHNPANLMWIKVCLELLPWVPEVAVFDTSFHQTLTPESYLYSLPQQYYEKYKLRRYGFHGISHEYVYNRAREIIWNNKLKAISCHIGNGASICAINNGNVMATSMWFTPMEWLIMWTRSGDIDPGALLFLMQQEWLSPQSMNDILNKESWVLWLSWYSSDLRDIEEWHIENDDKDTLVMNIYINQIVKYIGAYYVLMWWCNTIIFTAWVLEKSPHMRKLIVDKLACLGIYLDSDNNAERGTEVQITSHESKLPVWVIPTNEEWSIARQTIELL